MPDCLISCRRWAPRLQHMPLELSNILEHGIYVQPAPVLEAGSRCKMRGCNAISCQAATGARGRCDPAETLQLWWRARAQMTLVCLWYHRCESVWRPSCDSQRAVLSRAGMQWAAAAAACRRGQCSAGGERKRGWDGAPVVRTRLALPAHPAAAPAAAAIPLHRYQPAVSRRIL